MKMNTWLYTVYLLGRYIYRSRSLLWKADPSAELKLFDQDQNPFQPNEDHDIRIPEVRGFEPEPLGHFHPWWRDPKRHISDHPHLNHLKK